MLGAPSELFLRHQRTLRLLPTGTAHCCGRLWEHEAPRNGKASCRRGSWPENWKSKQRPPTWSAPSPSPQAACQSPDNRERRCCAHFLPGRNSRWPAVPLDVQVGGFILQADLNLQILSGGQGAVWTLFAAALVSLPGSELAQS